MSFRYFLQNYSLLFLHFHLICPPFSSRLIILKNRLEYGGKVLPLTVLINQEGMIIDYQSGVEGVMLILESLK